MGFMDAGRWCESFVTFLLQVSGFQGCQTVEKFLKVGL